MNRIFNEGVSSVTSVKSVANVTSVSSLSRVSPVSAASAQCRQSAVGPNCDITASNKTLAANANSLATKRPNKETAKAFKISFNGIFESKPRSEGSVASDSTASPVVSPMVALNNSRQSPTAVTNDSVEDQTRDEDRPIVASKRGRKRKVREVLDPLKDKLDVRRRIQKSQTTEELAQKFNIEVKYNENSRDELPNNRIVTTIRTNRNRTKNVSDVDDNETESKSELMQRFLSSQSSNTSPVPHEYNDYNYSHSNSVGYGSAEQQVISAIGAHTMSRTSEHCLTHASASSEPTSYPYPSTAQHLPPNTSSASHRNPVSSDSVGDEIKDILSHLPPLYVNDIVWSDCENNSSDNEVNSEDNRDNNRDNRDHNHNRDELNQQNDNQLIAINTNSDLETNNDSNNSFNNLVNNSNTSTKLKAVTDYEVEKYCDQRWEYVNGTYDAETEWRPWNHMTTAVSYAGDCLHILPYVDVYPNDHYINKYNDSIDEDSRQNSHQNNT